MLLNEAIKLRLENLMKEKEISSKYEISCDAGLNPSLLNDFFRSRTLYPRIDTLYLICEGMNITLEEFFKDPMFNIENIEIKDSKN
mgnify:CR=1 FL=1